MCIDELEGTLLFPGLFAIFRSLAPAAIAPSFEAKFARLEYTGANRFSLAFMRHTGEWIELYYDRSKERHGPKR